MSYSPVFCTLLVCFVFLCPTTPDEPPTADIRSLNRQLLHTSPQFKRGYLYLTLAAASTGHNFVKVADNVTKTCVLTASAIMTLFYLPSSHNTSASVIDRSVDQTIDKLQSGTNQSLIGILCDALKDEATRSQSANFDFKSVRQTTNYIQPQKSKNFFIAVPRTTTVDKFMKSGNMTFAQNAKYLLKFGTIRAFHGCVDERSNVDHHECMVVATVIRRLSHHENRTIRKLTDEMFKDALDKYYIERVYSYSSIEYYNDNPDYAVSFTKDLNQHIANNRTYTEEKELYTNYVNQTIGKLKVNLTEITPLRHREEL